MTGTTGPNRLACLGEEIGGVSINDISTIQMRNKYMKDWTAIWDNKDNLCASILIPNYPINFNESDYMEAQNDTRVHIFENLFYKLTDNDPISIFIAPLKDQIFDPSLAASLVEAITKNWCQLEEGYAGLCSTGQQNLCRDTAGPSSDPRDIIAQNINLNKLCACYVQPSPYTRIAKFIQQNGVQCDPFCRQAGNIGIPELDSKKEYSFKKCSDCICAITDVNITATKTIYGKDSVSLSEVCPSVSQGETCVCMFESINIKGLMDEGDIASQLSQTCGPNAVCIQQASNGTEEEVDCKTGQKTADKTISIPLALGILLILVALIAVVFMIANMLER